MLDLLTKKEDEEAASQGWCLAHVFDLTVRKWRVMILAQPNAHAGEQFVVSQAKAGNALSLKALSLVMASNKGNS